MFVGLLILSSLVAVTSADAQEHLTHGRYAEAISAYEDLMTAGNPPATEVVLGYCRALMETGEYDKARVELDQAIGNAGKDADLLARRAELFLTRGDIERAAKDIEAAMAIDPEHLAARYARAEWLEETGRIQEASDAYRWFVRHYNARQPEEGEALRYVALGSLKYARWNRVSPIFHFVVNELCPDMEKVSGSDWRPAAISGALLLEKHNEAQGMPDLRRALDRNPRAADVHAERAAIAFEQREMSDARDAATKALATNPKQIGALGTLIDLAVVEGRLPDADRLLGQALAVNPHDQELVARKVALLILDGKAEFGELEKWLDALVEERVLEEEFALGTLLIPLQKRNPRPGRFLEQMGKTFESRRLYARAERAFEAAVELMPELPGPPIALGMLSMRNGDIVAAKPVFERAFEADPFNVRVSNVRKVIALLEDYEELRTPHFVIRFDPRNDAVLAELAAEFLEREYASLTEEFGFEPANPTVVELFSTGQGQSGRQWFGARMVGLPWLHTIGASTGWMMALASPTRNQAFNWAETVRHELVHVVTLQQTDFAIPHWYTEALAVRSETFPRPELWNELIRKRVPAGEIQRWDELNEAFVQPETSDDLHFAYCQSLLYAEFLEERFGAEIHRKMLAAYADGKTTEEILTALTGMTMEKLNEVHDAYLKRVVAEIGPSVESVPIDEASQEIARRAVQKLRAGDKDKALEILKELEPVALANLDLVELVGQLRLAAGDAGGAAEMFEKTQRQFPTDPRWLKLHAAALLVGKDRLGLSPLLEELAGMDADDTLAAKQLAEMAREAGDAKSVVHWVLRALQVSPEDAELHEWLAVACDELGETERAEAARRHAKRLAQPRAGE